MRRLTLPVALVFCIFLIVSQVFALPDQITKRPTGDGTYGTYKLIPYPSSPSTRYDKVDEESSDGDSTFLVTTDDANTRYALFTKPALSLPSGATINYVRVYHKARTDPGMYPSTSAGFHVLYIGTTIYQGAQYDPAITYTDYYAQWSTNPSTGAAWTEAQVDAMQIGVKALSAYVYEEWEYWWSYYRITMCWMVVDYTVAPAGTNYTQVISETLRVSDSPSKHGSFTFTDGLAFTDARSMDIEIGASEQTRIGDGLSFGMEIQLQDSLTVFDVLAIQAGLILSESISEMLRIGDTLLVVSAELNIGLYIGALAFILSLYPIAKDPNPIPVFALTMGAASMGVAYVAAGSVGVALASVALCLSLVAIASSMTT